MIVVCALYLLAERSGLTERKQTHFTVTSDTNVSKVPGLSKYVTQEEVDSFAFRYWDIDYNSNPKNVFKELATDVELKRLLKSKQTDKILKFMKDNNLTVDHTMHGGVTPVMYSSFWDDTNTTQELIKLGADIHKKDEYKLSAMAYAIENNSTKTAKLLLDNGVKFEEVKAVQDYLYQPAYYRNNKTILEENGTRVINYEHKYGDVNRDHSKEAREPFDYIVYNNLTEMAQIVLNQGYIPRLRNVPYRMYIMDEAKNTSFPKSHYMSLTLIPDYAAMLNILLKYDVTGQPTQEELDLAYKHCVTYYLHNLGRKWDYIFHMRDYQKGEKILGGYGTARNERIARLHEEERKNSSFSNLKPEKSIQITPDPIILNYYDTAVRDYGRFCGDEKLTNLKEEDIKTEEEFDSLRDQFRDRNKTFPDTKAAIAYLNMAQKYEKMDLSDNRSAIIRYNGEPIIFDKYVKILQDKVDKSQGVKNEY